MAPREDSHPKTPQEKLEAIVIHKKHALLKDPKTPPRIKNLLDHKRDPRCTAEIVAYILFPGRSETLKDPIKSQSFFRSVFSWNQVRDDDFYKLKGKVQHADHVTEHTRMTVLNLLDTIRWA